MSARELSTLADLSPGLVALIESGARGFGQRSALALARTLGVSVEWLVEGRGSPPTKRSIDRAVRAALRVRSAA